MNEIQTIITDKDDGTIKRTDNEKKLLVALAKLEKTRKPGQAIAIAYNSYTDKGYISMSKAASK